MTPVIGLRSVVAITGIAPISNKYVDAEDRVAEFV
jgi:hypothetical protein